MGITGSSESSIQENGYLVVKVHEGSPAYFAGIQSFFDYIIKINNTLMDSDPDTLLKTISDCGDTPMNIIVYNSKLRNHRTVTVKRNPQWEGSSILGINVEFCNISQNEANVWHILEVYYSSPADVAGFRPYTDYIVGADTPLTKEDDLYTLIENNVGNPLKLIVYNSETDAMREVFIAPSNDWNKAPDENITDGLLGCGIGYGYLHRIPIPPAVQPIAVNTPLLPLKSAQADTQVNEPVKEVVEVIPPTQIPTTTVESVPVTSNYPSTYSEPYDQQYAQQYTYGNNTYAIPYSAMPPGVEGYDQNNYSVIPNPLYQPPYDPNQGNANPSYEPQYMPYPQDQIIIESSKDLNKQK